MAETAVAVKTGNILAKQRKKEQEDSTFVFPKLTDISCDMILKHDFDDTYRSSYSKAFDTKLDKHDDRRPAGFGRPCSSRRNRPHPRKDWLMWRAPETNIRKIKTTDDGGLWIWSKNDVVKDKNRYETEYSRLYAGPSKDTTSSTQERQRLLHREEVAKAKLPAFKESDQQATTSPTEVSQTESYGDLNKFLGSDIWKDKEVLAEMLNTADKRYLIKFLKTLSPEALFGLEKWLQARNEEKEGEEGESSRCPPIASPSQRQDKDETDVTPGTPPSTPAKDQNNGSHDYTAFTTMFDKDSKPKMISSPPCEDKKFMRNLIESGDYKQIEQFLSSMIQPEAVSGVTHWLISHEGQDREVALRFLGEVRFKPNKKVKDAEKSRENLESPSASGIKRGRKKRTPHGKNCSCSVCDAEHSNKILRALYKQGTASIVDEMRKALEYVPRPKRFVIRQQNQRKNQVPKLGGENLVRRKNVGYNANKNALFMQPHRILPSFFVIHPELPCQL